MANSIAHIFNQFAGKEVGVVETQQTFTFPAHGKTPAETFVIDEVSPKENDPILQQMEKAAKDKGFRLRVWFPGSVGTMDYDTRRVNAHVQKDPDGKYRVSPNFDLG